jgi:hypothetical protein
VIPGILIVTVSDIACVSWPDIRDLKCDGPALYLQARNSQQASIFPSRPGRAIAITDPTPSAGKHAVRQCAVLRQPAPLDRAASIP